MNITTEPPRCWNRRAVQRELRLARAAQALGPQLRHKSVATEHIVDLLNAVLEPGDRVCLARQTAWARRGSATARAQYCQ